MEASEIIAKLQDRMPSIMGHEHFRKSAVLVPLLEVKGETHLLFEVRSMRMRSQPGDICFPGGRIDMEDPDPRHCAVRETMEELGLSSDDISDVIPLDYVVNDLGRIIYPFVGRIANPEKIAPNKAEVEEVFTVPLSFFQKTKPEKYKVNFQVSPEDDFPYHLIVGGEDYNWQVRHMEELFYQYDEKVIWGLTAKILTHFIGLLKND
ncbi:NUDIX hydrolase [Oceanobacillus damuensis]|uniref:NUDIX hydrolase n=1 Tax=Oceanobacillus damuensis TaxID=937928 RepID=UPI00082DE968|nr:CoA pyrophosphatase [Oceanobacillus damuensis]